MLKQYDKNLIEKYISDGLLRRQWDDHGILQVLDYTKETTYENKWDDITSSCRGIVLNKKYKVVMPCMPKFFNFDQLDSLLQNYIIEHFAAMDKHIITKKYDGCLAAIFPYDDPYGGLMITSKCSFNSFVTDAAKEIIKDKLFMNDLEDMSLGLIVEVIHPKTHILVDYGDTKELRVITSFNLDTMIENTYEKTKYIVEKILKIDSIKMVEEVKFEDLSDLMKWQREHDHTEEGFVVKFENREDDIYRVKFKSDAYLSLAKASHHITYCAFVKYVIENWDNKGKEYWWMELLDRHIAHLPDEFQQEARKIKCLIELAYEFWYDKIFMLAQKVKNLSDKELGLKNDDLELNKMKKYVFSYRKGRDISLDLFKIIQEEDKKSRKGEE